MEVSGEGNVIKSMALFAGVTLPKHPCLENARKLDLLVLPMLRRMKRYGMAIDREFLWDLGDQFGGEMKVLAKDIASYIPVERLDAFIGRESESEVEADDEGVEFNPSSPDQIEKLLFGVLELGDGKKLKRTKGGRIATGKKQLETLRYDHPIIPKILRYREVSKLKTTYCDGLPKLARFHPRSDSCPVCELRHSVDQWRVHGEVGTTRAKTWRFNHKNPNLGNIPSRSDDGQMVQAGFYAPEGRIFAMRDLSQIELRGTAHLSQCKSMIDGYFEGIDFHTKTCIETGLSAPGEKPRSDLRRAAKATNFGIVNGTTKKGLYLTLVSDFGVSGQQIPDWLTEEWCDQFIKKWLDSYPEVREYFERQWYRARRYGLVWNQFGFCRLVPEVHSTHSWIREAGLRQAQNHPITSLAAGQMKMAMARLDWALEQAGAYEEQWAWPLMTIHDALIVECDGDRADDVQGLMTWAFDGCMDSDETGERMFRVPIESDGDCVTRWVK